VRLERQKVTKKRTHKLKALGNVADVIRTSPSLKAAARQLGVDRSTIHRWIEAGKVPRPAQRRPSPLSKATRVSYLPDAMLTPAAWAEAVRTAYELSPTETMLLSLAEGALSLARDDAAKPETRLAAMGRYQALVKQLRLEDSINDGKTETHAATAAWPRRIG